MIGAKKQKFQPNLEEFNKLLHLSVAGKDYDDVQAARDFRALFLRDPELGKRVLYVLLYWCEEYNMDIPPIDTNLLQRYAGKQEIAKKIKTALYADLTEPDL